jgi:hypothetical protein
MPFYERGPVRIHYVVVEHARRFLKAHEPVASER